MKQSFYFMSPEFYKLNKSRVPRKFSENIDDFLSLFPPIGPNVKVLVESTPDYLHTPGVIDRIQSIGSHFRSVYIIAILRHPVYRFISWHRFAIQQGSIVDDTSLESFYKMNRPICVAFKDTDSCFFAKDSGRYEKFIPSFSKAFGEKFKAYDFDQLQKNPCELMKGLCSVIGLDSSCYNDYEFNVSNKTVIVQSRFIYNAYMRLRSVYIAILDTPLLYIVKPIRNVISKMYHRMNDRSRLSHGGISDSDFFIKNELFNEYLKDIEFCNSQYGFAWSNKAESE
ncbi:hypothetical protein Ga0123462_1148 [Mariprofundus ferrinatatus]|uniref:Sulfotransferase family protein n=2 Tax=Mariprofundus ferrinatatus TaxID=1921087 RepID=A0A2K8L4H6_9PROT|nr:hypothetical protein Ga0123462_1148 [Mariprofundus ferrinatatus]